jgi:hypothetical protein
MIEAERGESLSILSENKVSKACFRQHFRDKFCKLGKVALSLLEG